MCDYVLTIDGEELTFPSVTRVELIDHSSDGAGCVFSNWTLNNVRISIQDDGRTLKVFVK